MDREQQILEQMRSGFVTLKCISALLLHVCLTIRIKTLERTYLGKICTESN